jgi:serpin B
MTFRLLLVTSAVVLSACEPNVPPPGEMVKSKQDRVTAAAPDADVTATVDSINTFGFDVYRSVAGTDGNAAFSPSSVSTVLGMLLGGAKGETAAGIKHALNVQLDDAAFHRAMNTIDLRVTSRGAGAKSKDGKAFKLRTNNQIFSQKKFSIEGSYLDLLGSEYGAGVALLDFEKEAEPSRAAINNWVKTNTEGLIPELLARGTIDSSTRLALVNTLYFNAAWSKPFKKEDTHDGDFHKLDGSTASVKMMNGSEISSSHAVVDGVDVLELPYDGGEVSLLVFAPQVAEFASFEASLNGAKLRSLKAALETETFHSVRMPKFEAHTQARLDDVLKQLGMTAAYDGADFSGISTSAPLVLGTVVHEAVVKTDEAGTEAAAATAAVVKLGAAIDDVITINRPFIYVILDRPTGAALFVGRITAP